MLRHSFGVTQRDSNEEPWLLEEDFIPLSFSWSKEEKMRAIVVDQPGPPEVLQIREVPRPQPLQGEVLIQVKAFGLNRSELFTRQGHSPGVHFPRILGIEAVGRVVAAPGTGLAEGEKVVALMGGMGRNFDGSYAEYTSVPASQVIPLSTGLAWPLLAALPETFLTAWGSLVESLELQAGESLLIRGGSSALGMAATCLASRMGIRILTTTRNPDKIQTLAKTDVERVLLDDGSLAQSVQELCPGGVDKVLELVGAPTLLDSLQATRSGGRVCMSGILGGWTLQSFEPLSQIPSTVQLTTYNSEGLHVGNAAEALEQIVRGVEQQRYEVQPDRVFAFEEMVQAHHYMEGNHARGKVVVSLNQDE